MTQNHDKVRILAVLPLDTQGEIGPRLNSLGMSPVFVRRATELSHIARSGEIFQVALLPASLPDMDWWTLWGGLALFNRRPAILVYAHTASFQLWSGVLEAGGYDVIVEPFTDEKLKEVLLSAADSFDKRASDGAGERTCEE